MGGRGETGLGVLVTGVGAPPGVSIMKACRQSALRPRVVATDADPASVGLFRAEVGYVVPRATSGLEAWLARLEDVCVRERVRLVCPGSEGELRALAPHREGFEGRTGACVVAPAPRLLDAFLDKWGTFLALAGRGMPVPDTVLAADGAAVEAFVARRGLPAVVKPRRGSGSRGVHRVDDRATLDLLLRLSPDAVLQEYVDGEEFTIGAYRSPREGWVGQIVFRRTLAAGLTYRAEVVRDEEIEEACRRVVEGFDLWGPVNLQLRRSDAGVRIFEINLRFSSSAPMRARFGFNEVELCLRDLVLGQTVPAPRIVEGWALRYWDELYLPAGAPARLEAEGERRGATGTKAEDL